MAKAVRPASARNAPRSRPIGTPIGVLPPPVVASVAAVGVAVGVEVADAAAVGVAVGVGVVAGLGLVAAAPSKLRLLRTAVACPFSGGTVSSKTKSMLVTFLSTTPPLPDPSPFAVRSMLTWPSVLLAEQPKKCV